MRKFYLLYYAESGRMTGMYSRLRQAFGRAPEPLLATTHDVMGELRLSWQEAVDRLGVPVEHFFRDQIPGPLDDYLRRNGHQLPAVVGLTNDGKNQLVCSSEQIAACQGKPDVLAEKMRQTMGRET